MKKFLLPALIVLLIPLIVSSVSNEKQTRVRVIAPSMPTVDEYSTVTIISKKETGEIDKDYTGKIWLWTDGPWIKPFNVFFRPEDDGVLNFPIKFNRTAPQRVEAYFPGDPEVHSWSNPIMPVYPDYSGQKLYWGKLGDCGEPGTDFCLTEGKNISKKNTDKKGRYKTFSKLVTIEAILGHETVFIVPDPSMPVKEMADFIINVESKKSNGLRAFLKKRRHDFLLARTVSPGMEKINLKADMFIVADQCLHENSFKESILKILTQLPDDRNTSLVPQKDGLIAVWANDNKKSDIYDSLKSKRVYASWAGRIIIRKEKDILKIFGNGPIEEVYYADSLTLENGLRQIDASDTNRLQINIGDMEKISPKTYRAFFLICEPSQNSGSCALITLLI
jgi:uncharacterized protein DUF3604